MFDTILVSCKYSARVRIPDSQVPHLSAGVTANQNFIFGTHCISFWPFWRPLKSKVKNGLTVCIISMLMLMDEQGTM